MILYHGTNASFEAIDLLRSKPNMDFGRGFYLSADKEQAVEMASVGVQLWRYETQAIDLPTLVHNLQYMKRVTMQYYFDTERAVKLLKRL